MVGFEVQGGEKEVRADSVVQMDLVETVTVEVV